MEKIVVLLSGGQDSTTCLYWAKHHFPSGELHALTVFYGQRHNVEINAAQTIAKMAGVESHKIISTHILKEFSESRLLESKSNISEAHHLNPKLPSSFVPGRNILLLTMAAMHAYSLGARTIVTGVCQTDYSGYPDCRLNTIQSLEKTLILGMDYTLSIFAPLMHITKADTIRIAAELGALKALAYSHTCYEGQIPPCGECPACKLRAKGFEEAGIEDPLLARLSHDRPISNDS